MQQGLSLDLNVRGTGARSVACLSQREWMTCLPRRWWSHVVRPVEFKHFCEYEMISERVLGYAVDEEPCFCEHFFILTDIQSDDDEEYFAVQHYAEHQVAWRLLDDRWLIYRCIRLGDASTRKAFFSFADRMPR